MLDTRLPQLPGTRTPAGWSFLGRPAVAGAPVSAGFVVEIMVDAMGFRVADRLTFPVGVAELISTALGDHRGPVVLLVSGALPPGRAADLLIGALADLLRLPVLAADAAVRVTETGALETDGAFRQWYPRGPEAPTDDPSWQRIRVVGSHLPAAPSRVAPSRVAPSALRAVGRATPTGPAGSAPAAHASVTRGVGAALARALPASGAVAPTALVGDSAGLLNGRRWSARWRDLAALKESSDTLAAPDPVAAAPALSAVAPASSAVEPGGAPTWIDDTSWQADDRRRLRQVLKHSYDAYARVVIRTLAEEPGLRAAGGTAELIADLVALCAFVAEKDTVNNVLRGRKGLAPDGRETLVARGAMSGLSRLPTVLGPVFVSGQHAAVAGAEYHAGDELVEPAFVDVNLSGSRPPDAQIEYVIWSVSARRVDHFNLHALPAATFPPGSRFAVLAVDPPVAGGPIRVLLRDQTGDRPRTQGQAQRLLDRLRSTDPAGMPPSGALPGGTLLAFPVGLDHRGQRFVSPPAGSAGRLPIGGTRP